MNNYLLLAAFVFLFSTSSIAQHEYNEYYDWRTYWVDDYPVSNLQDGSVKEVNIFYQHPKNKKPNHMCKRFNEKGLLTAFVRFDKKSGKEEPGIKITYDQYGHQASLERYDKGKLKARTEFIRLPGGQLLSVVRTNAKGKILEKSTWTYNADNCQTESVRYKKGGSKIANKWAYEYYDKCKRSKSTLYNSKGKAVNTWTYDCREEGEKMTKKANETQVCHWEQSSAEYITKVFQTFDEKGKTVKFVTRFTAKDTLPVEWLKYNEKEQLEVRQTFDRSFKKMLCYQYYRKAKLRSETRATYKDSLLTAHEWTLKGKFNGRDEYTYNASSQLLELKRYDKKRKVYGTISMVYVKRE